MSLASIVFVLTAAAQGNGEAPQVKAEELSEQPTALVQCLSSGDARSGIMSAMIACFDNEYSRKDDILNSRYQAVMAILSRNERQTLKISERRWIDQRDQTCKAQSRKTGGQDGEIEWRDCPIGETDKRIAWLASLRPKQRHHASD